MIKNSWIPKWNFDYLISAEKFNRFCLKFLWMKRMRNIFRIGMRNAYFLYIFSFIVTIYSAELYPCCLTLEWLIIINMMEMNEISLRKFIQTYLVFKLQFPFLQLKWAFHMFIFNSGTIAAAHLWRFQIDAKQILIYVETFSIENYSIRK